MYLLTSTWRALCKKMETREGDSSGKKYRLSFEVIYETLWSALGKSQG